MELYTKPPDYASRKYLNTVELLMAAKNFKQQLDSEGSKLGLLEKRKFQKSVELPNCTYIDVASFYQQTGIKPVMSNIHNIKSLLEKRAAR
jgi:hypothetical protein